MFDPFVFAPNYDGTMHSGAVATLTATGHQWVSLSGSALCFNYNLGWCGFLNCKEKTHFVMVHSDIQAVKWPGEGSWLDWMVSEMDARNLECLSVVNAIKGREGKTSTALGTLDPYYADKVGFEGLDGVPPTFDNEECTKETGKVLLVNTGLMVMRRGAWNEEFSFQFHDRIKEVDGVFTAQMSPEDWNMSRFFHARGLRYGVTREIVTLHHGTMAFPNYDDRTGFYR